MKDTHGGIESPFVAAHSVRRLELEASGPLVRVGAIPNPISVDRAEWVTDRLRDRGLSYRFVPVPVSGFNRHTVQSRDSYYASEEQALLLLSALTEGQLDLAVLALPELPRNLPPEIRVAAMTVPISPAYCILSARGKPLHPGSRVGVPNYALSRQLRAEHSMFHYEQRLYSFEQGINWVEQGIWQGVVVPVADHSVSARMQDFERLPLSLRHVVPPAGQGSFVLLVRTADSELAHGIFSHIHSLRKEKHYKLEVEISNLLRTGKEEPGCCIWDEGENRVLSLYNPNLQRPFQRWASKVVGGHLGEIDKQACFTLVQKVLGRLTLVGIGSGSPRDLTQEGKRVLERSECVFARSSQAEQLYYMLEGNCVIRDVEEETELFDRSALIQAIRQSLSKGLRTTILLHGDGYLYSRGGSLARGLAEQHLPFQFIPGMNLAVSATNRAGVPLLMPGLSSATHWFDGRDPLLEKQDFASLKGTCLISASRDQIPVLRSLLLKQGVPGHMPCLFLTDPGLPSQGEWSATLEEWERLPEGLMRAENGRGFLVVGEGVRMRTFIRSSAFFSQPLAGKTLLLPLIREMQDRERAWVHQWEEEGAHVVQLRLSVVRLSEEGRERLKSLFDQIAKGTLRLPSVVRPDDPVKERKGDRSRRQSLTVAGRTWLAFLSAESVQIFFAEMRRQGVDVRQFSGCGIAAATEQAFRSLAEEGIQADFVSPAQSAENLGVEMKRFLTPQDQVVILRGQGASGILESMLAIARIPVLGLGIYDQQVRLPQAGQLLRLFDDSDYILFLSPAVAEAFAQSMVAANLGHDALRTRPLQLLSATDGVRQALEERGFCVAGDLTVLGEPGEGF